MLRRRRCTHKQDESDLSEGFESDEEDEEEKAARLEGLGAAGRTASASSLGKEGKRDRQVEEGSYESASEEEGGTAFDVETDSDMNSQESRSDLEDMEDSGSPPREPSRPQPSPGEEGSTPPAANGPLLPNDPSITSNLQAVSSQLFQAKRCFRLAPTFSNVLLHPNAAAHPPPESSSSQDPTAPQGGALHSASPSTANGTNDNGKPPYDVLT